ncbi:MRC [Mytilus coruscus]|uniref:MRC n=1 Tax=Mytilus coruscus TaxID=42192 RepID=A0A6J8EZP9_MYTCO|nr:MRC [Mytilus coruscus]
MMPTCNLTTLFFSKVKVTSLVECACTCSQIESCSRLAWNSTEKECMLHSEKMITTSTGSIVSGLDLFSRGWQADCNREGYDFDYTTRTCLKLFDGPAVSWTKARALCKQDGADLISITTKLKWDFVYSYIRCADVAWIGLRNKTWTNGVSFVNVSIYK